MDRDHRHVLELNGASPLAEGGRRLVFADPRDPAALVKVMRPDYFQRASRLHRFLAERLLVNHLYAGYLRELGEQLALSVKTGRHPSYLQRILGFVDTDLGVGMVVERLSGRRATMAPSLAQVIERNGMDARLRERVRDFCELLRDEEVVLSNFSPRNIVCAADGENERMVLVDGYGEKVFIPINRLSRIAVRRTALRQFRRFRKHIEVCERRHERALRKAAEAETSSPGGAMRRLLGAFGVTGTSVPSYFLLETNSLWPMLI